LPCRSKAYAQAREKITNLGTGALSRVIASSNGVGLGASGSNVSLTATDAVVSNNNYGIGATSSTVMVRNSMIANNSYGIDAEQGAVVRVTQSTITGNVMGWMAGSGGQLQTYGNNNVSGNGTDGSPNTTLALE
jgi:nitrous oxidase accessory protein NosD